MSRPNFLVELGTEELPPTSLRKLAASFANGIETGLSQAGLAFAKVEWYATPRRLAVRIEELQQRQDDQQETLYGPPAKVAFDADGNPTKAALGFAARSGVDISALTTAPDDGSKNAGKLMLQRVIEGQDTRHLIAAIVQTSVDQLPIPKRMRWGSSRVEFLRPVQWLVMLMDSEVIDGEVLGLTSSNISRGHRFHAPETFVVESADRYVEQLREAFVIASFAERLAMIEQQVTEAGQALGGKAVIDADLLDEVTALNEWPVALAGNFEKRFLQVPAEALISSMKEHQKYFHVVDHDEQLLPNFITVSNIASKDPAQVIAGNERVIRPRLADAAFFWDTDRKQPLANRFAKLENVVWVKNLGSIADKARRIGVLGSKIAEALNADKALVQRASELCKNDLVTSMVYEFPDLQGLAGQYYAQHDGEAADVCAAMLEQYKPAFAGDELPSTATGTIIALADRLDSLVGLFGIKQIPTGSKDPFALRRASLGVLRLLVEHKIDIDLRQLIQWALAGQWHSELDAATEDHLIDYMLDRFSAWYQDENIPADVFQSVRALSTSNALDINRRVQAVSAFRELEQAQALAAANKRVANILAKNNDLTVSDSVDQSLLKEPAEVALAEAIAAKQTRVTPLLDNGDYQAALTELASLRETVDAFFDNVMVMADDEAVKLNRLALLSQLQALFIAIADISVLQ